MKERTSLVDSILDITGFNSPDNSPRDDLGLSSIESFVINFNGKIADGYLNRQQEQSTRLFINTSPRGTSEQADDGVDTDAEQDVFGWLSSLGESLQNSGSEFIQDPLETSSLFLSDVRDVVRQIPREIETLRMGEDRVNTIDNHLYDVAKCSLRFMEFIRSDANDFLEAKTSPLNNIPSKLDSGIESEDRANNLDYDLEYTKKLMAFNYLSLINIEILKALEKTKEVVGNFNKGQAGFIGDIYSEVELAEKLGVFLEEQSAMLVECKAELDDFCRNNIIKNDSIARVIKNFNEEKNVIKQRSSYENTLIAYQEVIHEQYRQSITETHVFDGIDEKITEELSVLCSHLEKQREILENCHDKQGISVELLTSIGQQYLGTFSTANITAAREGTNKIKGGATKAGAGAAAIVTVAAVATGIISGGLIPLLGGAGVAVVLVVGGEVSKENETDCEKHMQKASGELASSFKDELEFWQLLFFHYDFKNPVARGSVISQDSLDSDSTSSEEASYQDFIATLIADNEFHDMAPYYIKLLLPSEEQLQGEGAGAGLPAPEHLDLPEKFSDKSDSSDSSQPRLPNILILQNKFLENRRQQLLIREIEKINDAQKTLNKIEGHSKNPIHYLKHAKNNVVSAVEGAVSGDEAWEMINVLSDKVRFLQDLPEIMANQPSPENWRAAAQLACPFAFYGRNSEVKEFFDDVVEDCQKIVLAVQAISGRLSLDYNSELNLNSSSPSLLPGLLPDSRRRRSDETGEV